MVGSGSWEDERVDGLAPVRARCGERAGGCGRRSTERPVGDRAGSCRGVGVVLTQQRQRRRGDQRGADALDDSGGDQQPHARCQPAGGGSDHEQDHAEAVDSPPPSSLPMLGRAKLTIWASRVTTAKPSSPARGWRAGGRAGRPPSARDLRRTSTLLPWPHLLGPVVRRPLRASVDRSLAAVPREPRLLRARE
jgi:hypothetical protein